MPFGIPCYGCKHLLWDMDTSDTCNKNKNFLEIYNNAHKQQGTQIQEHCTDACAYLEEDK